MPTPTTAKWPKPRSEDEFEDIVTDFLRIRWKDPDATRNGRRGQRQHGVDIVGQPHGQNRPAGGQCKNTESPTLAMVKGEVEKAKQFPGGLSQFLFVTTADRDAELQAAVREHYAATPAPFHVETIFWQDIVADLAAHPRLVAKHWRGFQRPTPRPSLRPIIWGTVALGLAVIAALLFVPTLNRRAVLGAGVFVETAIVAIWLFTVVRDPKTVLRVVAILAVFGIAVVALAFVAREIIRVREHHARDGASEVRPDPTPSGLLPPAQRAEKPLGLAESPPDSGTRTGGASDAQKITPSPVDADRAIMDADVAAAGAAANTTGMAPTEPCQDGSQIRCGSDLGQCKAGVRICEQGRYGACRGAVGPAPEVCDGIDNDCDGIIDSSEKNGVRTSACACQPVALRATVVRATQEQSTCAPTQCAIGPDGLPTMTVCLTAGQAPYGWARCEFGQISLNQFDADNGSDGVIEVSFCVDRQINANVGISYGRHPRVKTLRLVEAGTAAGCQTRYFRPEEVTCGGPMGGLPQECRGGCEKGRWGPACRFDYDRVPFALVADRVTAETSAAISIKAFRFHPSQCR